jgi:hypothetical protein
MEPAETRKAVLDLRKQVTPADSLGYPLSG